VYALAGRLPILRSVKERGGESPPPLLPPV